jgi:hypothetical protein
LNAEEKKQNPRIDTSSTYTYNITYITHMYVVVRDRDYEECFLLCLELLFALTLIASISLLSLSLSLSRSLHESLPHVSGEEDSEAKDVGPEVLSLSRLERVTRL